MDELFSMMSEAVSYGRLKLFASLDAACTHNINAAFKYNYSDLSLGHQQLLEMKSKIHSEQSIVRICWTPVVVLFVL